QALTLLNDATGLEAARMLGLHALNIDSAASERLNNLAERILGRSLVADELSTLQTTLETVREGFKKSPGEAQRLIEVGDMPAGILASGEFQASGASAVDVADAAVEPPEIADEWATWMTAASLLLNLDETITRE
ncbi:MAG: hypothetical protein KDA91_23095, partial [Planctomycetaceae bacterium]|nr:hypothetical protein [Planctomycetaceae bacterium]